MALFKPGTRGWRILTLAIVAVPWLLRDQLATTLDEKTMAAAEVLNEYEQEEGRQQIDEVQRETMQRIVRIEKALAASGNNAAGNAAEDMKEYIDEVKGDGKKLIEAADGFIGRLDKLSLAAADSDRLKKIGEQARKAGEALDGYDGTDERDSLVDAYDKAAEAFGKAYEELHGMADKARDETARLAGWSRLVAWILTALGGLMVTGFKPANVLDDLTGAPKT